MIVASGNCNAYSGVGDPYLPFRDVLGMLTGDVEARWAAGAISQTHARQLWALLPHTVAAIIEHGPDLVDVFVSGPALKKRAQAGMIESRLLQALTAMKISEEMGGLGQTQLFEAYTAVLRALAAQKPLLLLLDDLQWADNASISLLFHLGRRLPGSRILILGAYRPSEVALGRPATGMIKQESQHPLQPMIKELIRQFGNIQLDLAQTSQAEGRGFIDALLDSQPNRLGEAFRAAMFERTQGHPLFTIELLRALQEGDDLIQDDQGYWTEGSQLVWEMLPVRVEAVIEQRIGRLGKELRDILTVASVEGEDFTAQVVAQIQGVKERVLLHQLSQELEQRHRLVREYEEVAVGRRLLSRYQFGHALFQHYLYEGLSGGERRLLHREIAQVLETLYDGYQDKITPQLAHHYLNANELEQAHVYLVQAGDQARRVAALDEAARYYRTALEQWPAHDQAGQAEILRKLGECLWVAGHLRDAAETFEAGFDIFEALGDWQNAGAMQRLMGQMVSEQEDRAGAFRHFRRALTILEQGPENVELAHALSAISRLHMMASEYTQAISWGERALALAERLEAEAVTLHALNNVGVSHACSGNWERGSAMLRDSLNRALSLNLPHDVCRAYYNLGDVLQGMGNHAEARIITEELLAYANQMHVSHHLSSGLVRLAELDWLSGQWAAALERRLEIMDWLVSHQSLGHLKLATIILFSQMYNDLGLSQAARQEVEDKLAIARSASALQAIIPCLGELLRAYNALGMEAEATAMVTEINHWLDGADYLNLTSPNQLLLACQWLAQAKPANPKEVRTSLQRLERADHQIRSPISATCLSEGQGYVALVEFDPYRAAEAFRQAVAGWETLGRPYDQARALNGLGQALAQAGEMTEAKPAFDRAMGLIDSLAAQLDDPELKASFLNSTLVRAIREGLKALNSG